MIAEHVLLEYANADQGLLCLLYDLDLMPEQTINTKKYEDTLAIIDHWRAARLEDHAHVRDALTRAIPNNWCDPLLTGEKAALPGSGAWGCPDIERLLDGLRARLVALLDAAGKT